MTSEYPILPAPIVRATTIVRAAIARSASVSQAVVWIALALMSCSLQAAQPVTAAPLADIALRLGRSAPATVVSLSEVSISAEVSGTIVEFPHQVGDTVAAGDEIARIDCRSFRHALAASQADQAALDAQIVLAQSRLRRAEELSARQSLARDTLEQRRAELAIREAEHAANAARIAGHRVTVSRCRIVAPFRALVLSRDAPRGDYVAIGDPIASIVAIDELEVSALAQPADVAALLSVPSLEFVYQDQRYPVIPRVAVAAVDSQARTREVRLTFVGKQAPTARPLVGTAGQLRWSDPRVHVPGNVLVPRADSLGVFVVDGGVARYVPVAGAQAGRASPVDLDESQLVITQGQYGLQDGDPVEVTAR